MRSSVVAETQPQPAPSFGQAFRIWVKIGILSFGGPSAQIALMHREIVDRFGWLSERQFLSALSFCMLLPGPEAMQLATYAGWRLHGIRGGLAAGLMFVLPGALVILALSMVYAALGTVVLVETLFTGIKAAVLIIVIDALRRIAGRALSETQQWIIAALSFVGIFFLALPFPLIVFAAGLLGFFRGRAQVAADQEHQPSTSARATAGTIAVWLAVWLVPLAALFVAVGSEHVFSELAWFFSKLAIVTFGGAYAVLAYMAQDAVGHYGWLQPGEMLDGLGLAETTPGPLILVTEFVGYIAAYRHAGEPAWLAGLAGAAVTLWATFAPCFLWIFAGAPYIEWIAAQPALRGALSAITAAVVGVMLNLAVWFGLHVFFADVGQGQFGPFSYWWPDPSTIDVTVGGLALLSGLLLLKGRLGVPLVLAISAIAAVVLEQIGLATGT